jgi:hypothetical protein
VLLNALLRGIANPGLDVAHGQDLRVSLSQETSHDRRASVARANATDGDTIAWSRPTRSAQSGCWNESGYRQRTCRDRRGPLHESSSSHSCPHGTLLVDGEIFRLSPEKRETSRLLARASMKLQDTRAERGVRGPSRRFPSRIPRYSAVSRGIILVAAISSREEPVKSP